MTIIEQIKAEIERKRDQNRKGENSYYDVNDIKNAGICRHRRILCEELLSFLSTLEYEDKCYFYCKYGGILPTCSDCKRNLLNSRISKEQVQGWLSPDTHSKRCNSKIQLEEKSEKPMNLDFEQELYNRFGMVKDFTLGMRIAQAFYDLGCRRTADKYDEIEYNRQRAEEHLATSGKTISVKPGDEVTINGHKIVYNKDKGYVTIVKSEESVPKDLEEAAKEYAEKHEFRVPYDGSDNFYDDVDVKASKEGFIAGAKWQADHAPLPEDTVLFNKGVEEGKRLMMEEAVEYEVWDFSVEAYPHVNIPLDNKQYRNGDKVRVIVCKNED